MYSWSRLFGDFRETTGSSASSSGADEVDEPGPHGLVADVQVERPDERLERRRQQRRSTATGALGLAFAEEQVRPEVEATRQAGESGGRDDRGATGGQGALVVVRVARVEGLGHAQADDGVTQELEPLVVAADSVRVLVEPAGMDEGLLEQVQVADRETQALGDRLTRAHRCRRPRPT